MQLASTGTHKETMKVNKPLHYQLFFNRVYLWFQFPKQSLIILICIIASSWLFCLFSMSSLPTAMSADMVGLSASSALPRSQHERHQCSSHASPWFGCRFIYHTLVVKWNLMQPNHITSNPSLCCCRRIVGKVWKWIIRVGIRLKLRHAHAMNCFLASSYDLPG